MNIKIEWGAIFNAQVYFEESDWCYDFTMIAISDHGEEISRNAYDWREDGYKGPGSPSLEELEEYASFLRERYPGATVTW